MTTWIISLDGRPERWADLTVPAGVGLRRKHDELRRTGCRMRPGDLVLVYATAPQSAVVGQVYCRGLLRVSVDELVRPHRVDLHRVNPDDVRAYAAELDHLTVIQWHSDTRYPDAIPLDELRRLGMRQPPQTWRKAPPQVAAAAGRQAKGHLRPVYVECTACGGDVLMWTTAPQLNPCGEPGHHGQHSRYWPADDCAGCQGSPFESSTWAVHGGDSGRCMACDERHTVSDDGVLEGDAR